MLFDLQIYYNVNDKSAMETLKCFMCRKSVKMGLNGLIKHLKIVHGLTFKEGIQKGGFECGQEGCYRRFSHFFSFKDHIKKVHLPIEEDDSECSIESTESFPVNNDNIITNNNDESGSYENTDNVEALKCNEFNLKDSLIRMIIRLHSNVSMTGSTVTNVLDEYEEITIGLCDLLKTKVEQFLQSRKMLDDPDVNDLLNSFHIKSSFEGLRTLEQQMEAVKCSTEYIEPQEIPLGIRIDNVIDKETSASVPKTIIETCQYVPIIDTLTMVLKNKDVRAIIESETESNNGILASFIDGQHFKNHPFFQKYKHAIRLQLYYDELEIVNPLGSKTGIHKLGVFYYTIQNLLPHMNSEISSIHVLLLCCHTDIKKYKFEKILSPFLNDLAKLENDEGITIFLGEEKYVLRASLVAFCGDGLAVHEVFNLLSPSSNLFCRMCLYDRQDLLNGSTERKQLRNIDVYNEHLNILQNANYNDNAKTLTGMHGDCCLHSSRYFHVCKNLIFDPMHDILCGIGPMILKLVLVRYILQLRLFNADDFNNKIVSFQYGFVERKNKPSANFSERILNQKGNTLNQKAMQIWCLLRIFPFLISNWVPTGEKHLQLILLLLRIMEIVFAPKVTTSLMSYLRALITDFLETFKQLFPDVRMINKFHHLTHYPHCILWSGPLQLYNCMRYEAKHNEIKLRSQNVHNFKNPPKTLIRVVQCSQSAKWGRGDVTIFRAETFTGETVTVQYCQSRTYLHTLGYVDTDSIFSTNNIKINGVQFRLNLLVCLENDKKSENHLPLFGHIEEIIMLERNEVYFLTTLCKTLYFDTDFNAYYVERETNTISQLFVNCLNIAHYKPLSVWSESASHFYVSLRHILL